ncbi:hypothetical protein [Paenibacillus koleovorans]|uniref:hypothetical protein n=1 Tax=Paenibacillus koleovorans TaxID=121608 RepID=UPI000FDC0585|nr:hypothetical protein [Paenibacillus koleovorans]
MTTNRDEVPYFGAGVIVEGTYSQTFEGRNSKFISAGHLCYKEETPYFGFRAENQKLLSVCVSSNPSYIVYRYGKHENVELEYPGGKTADSWGSFEYYRYLRGGGAMNAGLDLNSLSFVNGGYKYELHDDYDAVENQYYRSIRVIDLKTNQETVIKALDSGAVGGLTRLQGSRVKQAAS